MTDFYLNEIMNFLFLVGFDVALASILGKLSQNKSLRKLSIGRNLNNVKPKCVDTASHFYLAFLVWSFVADLQCKFRRIMIN